MRSQQVLGTVSCSVLTVLDRLYGVGVVQESPGLFDGGKGQLRLARRVLSGWRERVGEASAADELAGLGR